MIANQLVANAVISQTVADQTRVIQQQKREGYPFKLRRRILRGAQGEKCQCGRNRRQGLWDAGFLNNRYMRRPPRLRRNDC
jgi:hypothetical protein